jgi:hypothetical protein
VKRGQGLVPSPEAVKSSIVEEEAGGRILRGSGEGTLGGLPRENKDLCEVAKSDLNPDHWLWKGTQQRSMYFRGGTLWIKFKRREYSKS